MKWLWNWSSFNILDSEAYSKRSTEECSSKELAESIVILSSVFLQGIAGSFKFLVNIFLRNFKISKIIATTKKRNQKMQTPDIYMEMMIKTTGGQWLKWVFRFINCISFQIKAHMLECLFISLGLQTQNRILLRFDAMIIETTYSL